MRFLALPLALFLSGCAAIAPPRAPRESSGPTLFVLGIAQDGGLPHLGCQKTCCREARAQGRVEHPTSLGIQSGDSLLLVEATPSVEAQLALLHQLTGNADRGRRPIDAVLISHAHIGHYLGLAQFGREVAATSELPVFGTERFSKFLREHGPWQQLVSLRQIVPAPIAFEAWFEPMAGVSVRAIQVPHRDEYSDTVAFQIRGPRRTVLFCPDIDAWSKHEGLLERLLDGVDIAYLDGTFYDGRELPERIRAEIPHPPITDTMQRLGQWAQTRPGAIRFIHLNHTNPALHDAALRDAIEQRGFAIARQGECIEL